MLGEQFVGPSLKAMRTLVIRPLQGYGTLLPLATQTPGGGSQTASTYPTQSPPHILVHWSFFVHVQGLTLYGCFIQMAGNLRRI